MCVRRFMLRPLGAGGLILALAAGFWMTSAQANIVPRAGTSSDDKCPDGSKKDPELGCRQTTKAAKRDKSQCPDGSQKDSEMGCRQSTKAKRDKDDRRDRAKGSDKTDKADKDKNVPK